MGNKTHVMLLFGSLSIALQPLEVCRLAQQINPAQQKPSLSHYSTKGILDIINFAKATEGYSSLFRGAFTSLIKTSLGSVIMIYLAKKVFNEENSIGKQYNLTLTQQIFTLCAIKNVITNPLEIVYTRLSMLGFNRYEGLFDGIARLLNEGSIFRGALTQCATECLQFATGFKLSILCAGALQSYLMRYSHYLSDNYRKNVACLLSCAIGAAAGSLITCPFQVILARSRFSRFNSIDYQKGKDTYECLRNTVMHDRIRWMYKGLLPYMTKSFILLYITHMLA